MSNINQINLYYCIFYAKKLNGFFAILFILFLISCSKQTINNSIEPPINLSINQKTILEEFDISNSYENNTLLQRQKQIVFKHKNIYLEKFQKAHMIVPTIANKIAQKQLPKNLLFLIMAESGFEIHAKSKKKAVGLWQLMPKTAKIYKLQMNTYVDERMDIIKSSDSALEHLEHLHNKFDKWYLAIMAYNGGEARIMEGITRAILDKHCKVANQCRRNNKTILKYRKTIESYQQKQISFKKLYKVYKKVKKLPYNISAKDLLAVQPKIKRQYMPRESAIYLRRIISLAYLKEDFTNVLSNSDEKIIAMKIKGGVSLMSIASITNMSYEDLSIINHQIKRAITSPYNNVSIVYIPTSRINTFKQNLHLLPPIKYIIYKIKKGDSLISIAKYYSLPYELIKKTNNMKNNNLRINKEILIPLDENTYLPPKTHTVAKGDSLLYIASLYKTNIKKLKLYNKLTNTNIKIGDKLIVNQMH